MRVALLVALLAAAPAAAQELRVDNNQTTYDGASLKQSIGFTLNAADCADDEPRLATFVLNGATRESYDVQLAVDEGIVTGTDLRCQDHRDEDDFLTPVLTNVDVSGARVEFDVSLSPAAMVPDGFCDGAGDAAEVLLCVYFLDANEQQLQVEEWPILVDTSVPPRPTITSVSGGNRSLTIAVEDPDDGEAYDLLVQWRLCDETATSADGGTGDDDDATADGGATTIGEGDLPDVADTTTTCGATGAYRQTRLDAEPFVLTDARLVNGEQVELRVAFVDAAGNVGPTSDVVRGTPIEGRGALDAYQGAGAGVSCAPSCETGEGYGTAALFGALLVSLRRRKRRRAADDVRAARATRPTVVAALFVVVAPLVATDEARARSGAMTIGVDVGAYVPAIDEETLASGAAIYPVYQCFYGDAMVPMFGLDLDWTIVDEILGVPVGSLQAGVALRGTQIRGHQQPLGVNVTNPALAASCLHTEGLESVELTLLQVAPALTYRLDPLLELVGFPLVPYVRLGLVGAGFAFTKGGTFDDAGVSRTPPVNPVGARFGWEGALGLALALDFLDGIDPFDPYTIKRARAAGVFEHAYFFAEATYQNIDDFGTRGILLHPDDRLFSTRLPIMFSLGLAVDLM